MMFIILPRIQKRLLESKRPCKYFKTSEMDIGAVVHHEMMIGIVAQPPELWQKQHASDASQEDKVQQVD